MFYKDPTVHYTKDGIEAPVQELYMYSSKTNIKSSELPDYLNFPDFYEFFGYNCRKYAESVSLNNFVEANESITLITKFFMDNIEKFKSIKIDFSTILRIFVESKFLFSLYDAIRNGDPNYFMNCVDFIGVITFISDDFSIFLSKEDFIYPLTNFYVENLSQMNFVQAQNVFIAINNLISFYPDKSYSVFFCNRNNHSFYEIFHSFQQIAQQDNLKLVKLFYIVIQNLKIIDEKIYPFIPILINFFDYTLKGGLTYMEFNQNKLPETFDQVFNFTILSLYYILGKQPDAVIFLFKLEKLFDNLNYFYRTSEKCGDHWINYYSFLTRVIINSDKETNQEGLKQRFETILKLLENDEEEDDDENDEKDNPDLILMLKSSKEKDNLCILDLIDALVNKRLFKLVFKDPIQTTKDIIELFDESSFKIKLKAFICLKDILIDNFDFYSQTILINIPTSVCADLIESEDTECQFEVLSFLKFVLNDQKNANAAIPQDDQQLKSFAFLLYEDDDLMESISAFISNINQNDEQMIMMAKIIRQKIFFWVDGTYDSTNTLNDNYYE